MPSIRTCLPTITTTQASSVVDAPLPPPVGIEREAREHDLYMDRLDPRLFLVPAASSFAQYNDMAPSRVAPPPNPPASRFQHREGMGGSAQPVAMAPTPRSSLHPSLFNSLTPNEDQAGDIADLALAAGRFAREIERLVPQDGTALPAINALRRIVFWVREAILRDKDGIPRHDYRPVDDGCAIGAAGATVIPSRQATVNMGSVSRQP